MKQYPNEFRDRAVRLVAECRGEHDSEWAAIREVGSKLGVGPETVRKWVRASQARDGAGSTREEQEEIRRLRKENAELRRAGEIPRSASAFFAARLDRPATR